jgi:hypothetical protein
MDSSSDLGSFRLPSSGARARPAMSNRERRLCGLQQLSPCWHNMSLASSLVGSSSCAVGNLFPCVELQRLK